MFSLSERVAEMRRPAWTAIVQRELVVHLRTVRPFALLVIVCVVTTFMLSGALRMMSDAIALGFASRIFVNSVVWSLFIYALLTVPAHAATLIVSERTRNTLEMMILCPTGAASVCFGKFLSVVGAYTLLILGIMPIIAVLFMLTGVDWFEFLTSLVLIYSATISLAAAGLASSALFTSERNSIGGAYLLTLVVLGIHIWLPLAAYTWLRWIGIGAAPSSAAQQVMQYLMAVSSPLSALLMRSTLRLTGDQVVVCVLHQLVLTCLFMWAACFILRRIPRVKGIAPPQTKPKRAKRATSRDLCAPLEWVLCRDGLLRGCWNPVFAKEIAQGDLNRPKLILAVAAVSLSVIAVIEWQYGIHPRWRGDREVVAATLMGIMFGVAILLFPGRTATAMRSERDGETIDALHLSLLSAREVVFGKFVAAIAGLTPFVTALFLPFIICSMPHTPWPDLGLFLFVSFVVLSFWSLSLGLLLSQITRRGYPVATAVAWNTIVFFVAPYLFLVASVLMFSLPEIEELLIIAPPVWTIGYSIARHGLDHPLNTYWAANMALYGFLSGWMVWMTLKSYRREAGK